MSKTCIYSYQLFLRKCEKLEPFLEQKCLNAFFLLPSDQLWCAVGVNLSGGKTRDGGSVVGASVFYKDVAGLETEGSKQRSASQSSLDKLDQELKVSLREHSTPDV